MWRCMPTTQRWTSHRSAARAFHSKSLGSLQPGEEDGSSNQCLRWGNLVPSKVFSCILVKHTFPKEPIWAHMGGFCCFQKLRNFRNPATHMDTLKNILAANGDEKSDVFYLKVFIFLKLAEAMAELWGYKLLSLLKVDIEGAELSCLPEWVKSGGLDRVKLKTF